MANATSVVSRRRERTRDTILEATSSLVAEKGTDGFTISEVAHRGGVNGALIYHYFKDRDNLVFETIRYIAHKYERVRPAVSPDAIEHDIRMHIQHPEIGRFFFQLLLSGRPLPALGERMLAAIEDLERIRKERAPTSSFDPPLAIIAATLVQLAWPFARQEMARHLGITVEDADERFIAQLKRTSRTNLEMLASDTR